LPKTFFLEPGLLARCDGLWYEPGILLVVEPGDRVEIFSALKGLPTQRKAQYEYRQLDNREPPLGLRGDWRGRLRPGGPRRNASLSAFFAPRVRRAWAAAPALA
jgi:hypothetical protein